MECRAHRAAGRLVLRYRPDLLGDRRRLKRRHESNPDVKYRTSVGGPGFAADLARKDSFQVLDRLARGDVWGGIGARVGRA